MATQQGLATLNFQRVQPQAPRFERKTMRNTARLGLSAALLATLSWASWAQTAPTAAPDGSGLAKPTHHEHRMAPPDPAQMQAHFAKRSAELKAKLKITAPQEPAWQAFTDAAQPPATLPQRPDPAAWAKLTTPERIAQMESHQQAKAQHQAKRAQATKALYAVLSPEQQKTFDAETLQTMGPPRHPHHPPERDGQRPARQP